MGLKGDSTLAKTRMDFVRSDVSDLKKKHKKKQKKDPKHPRVLLPLPRASSKLVLSVFRSSFSCFLLFSYGAADVDCEESCHKLLLLKHINGSSRPNNPPSFHFFFFFLSPHPPPDPQVLSAVQSEQCRHYTLLGKERGEPKASIRKSER